MIEGMHPRGHQGIGGMNDDLYAGNGDPAFYFHHAQVSLPHLSLMITRV
jgi:hypothetical protein